MHSDRDWRSIHTQASHLAGDLLTQPLSAKNMNKFSLLLIVLILPLLSSCASVSSLSQQEKTAFTGLKPVTSVTLNKNFQLPSEMEANLASDIAPSADPEEGKIRAQMVQALSTYKVNIQEIVAQKLQEEQQLRPALQPKAGQSANSTLSVSIQMFGVANGFSRDYGPNLGLRAQLHNAQGKVVWEKYKYVNYTEGKLPRYRAEELLDNPDALRFTFEVAAKQTAVKLLDSLEAELRLGPTVPRPPVAATPRAPVAVIPQTGIAPTPVPSTQPQPTPVPVPPSALPAQKKAQSAEEEPSCNGWCGMPNGEFKLD